MASGVRLSQAALTADFELRAFFRSEGMECKGPFSASFLVFIALDAGSFFVTVFLAIFLAIAHQNLHGLSIVSMFSANASINVNGQRYFEMERPGNPYRKTQTFERNSKSRHKKSLRKEAISFCFLKRKSGRGDWT